MPEVVIQTSKGNIKLELYDKKTPATVENFLSYVTDQFYDGTIFHRVIDGFMIQGGGFTEDMKQKKTNDPIVNEAEAASSNARGTIAMARTSDPHSATSQFFINVQDNTFLDQSPQGHGYCAFGKVIEGMDIVDTIKKVSTHSNKGFDDVPEEPVVIKSIKITKK
ncbi:MAG: peptidylprolyl isomerase [Waddliaceae bacterium]